MKYQLKIFLLLCLALVVKNRLVPAQTQSNQLHGVWLHSYQYEGMNEYNMTVTMVFDSLSNECVQIVAADGVQQLRERYTYGLFDNGATLHLWPSDGTGRMTNKLEWLNPAQFSVVYPQTGNCMTFQRE